MIHRSIKRYHPHVSTETASAISEQNDKCMKSMCIDRKYPPNSLHRLHIPSKEHKNRRQTSTPPSTTFPASTSLSCKLGTAVPTTCIVFSQCLFSRRRATTKNQRVQLSLNLARQLRVFKLCSSVFS